MRRKGDHRNGDRGQGNRKWEGEDLTGSQLTLTRSFSLSLSISVSGCLNIPSSGEEERPRVNGCLG